MSDYLSPVDSDRASSPEPAPAPSPARARVARHIEKAHDKEKAYREAELKLKAKKDAAMIKAAHKMVRIGLEELFDKAPTPNVENDAAGLVTLLEQLLITVEDVTTGNLCPVPSCRKRFEHGYSMGGHLMRQGGKNHLEFRAQTHQ
ncbi:hypothetical protein HDU87_008365 [Geranomyces variabilis]|uniref:Uncharacterized protein n=1 Tax=Geranomyces variabilis TaxID=109894 RepID=A0AAD5TCZ0_9FUNG|nr:hypothetical protein HDU87_008365 [Geranomyces variabilis]